MILTLMGMAGVGKSFWAGRLAAHGFAHIDCDALIAAKLGLEPSALGAWMGFPDDPGYARREAALLAHEAAVLRETSAALTGPLGAAAGHVIDTGGSVVYAEAALLEELRRRSIVVYLAVPPAAHAQMLDAYLTRPRPLVWNGLFAQAPDEGRAEAFRRCYARLIAEREALYRRYSHVTLAYDFYRDPELPAADFLRAVREGAGGYSGERSA